MARGNPVGDPENKNQDRSSGLPHTTSGEEEFEATQSQFYKHISQLSFEWSIDLAGRARGGGFKVGPSKRQARVSKNAGGLWDMKTLLYEGIALPHIF
jgi:hypothetical protein